MKKFINLLFFAFFANVFLHPDAFGQITQVTGSPQTSTTTTSTLTITKPSGLAVGHVLLANIIQSGDGNTISDATISGWTEIAGNNLTSSTGIRYRTTLLYKIANASDVAAANFSVGLDSDADDASGAILAFAGVDITGGVDDGGAAGGPFDVDPASSFQNINADNTLDATAISTASAEAAVIMFGALQDDQTLSGWTTSSPGALAEIYDLPFDATMDMGSGAAWAIKSTAGSTGTGNATIANAATPVNGAIFIALKKYVAPAPPTPIGCNGQYYVSYGSAGTASSTTSMSKLTFNAGVITANPFTADPTGIGFNGIGINPVDGFLYGIRYAPARLVRVAANAPGNIVDLGPVSNASLASGDNVYAGCFDTNGDYYFISDQDEMFKISGLNYPASPLTATFVGTVTNSSFFIDIAIDPTDGQMYGVAGTAAPYNLYAINKATGALTLKGAYTGTNYIAALFFDETGNLFGYRQDGTFQKVNKADASLTQVGTAPAYTYADGCSCSFGRVYHDLDFTANVGNQLCPFPANLYPTFPLVVTVTNQSNATQTGLTYTLDISDPAKRFRFTESAATILAALQSAGLADGGSTVTLTAESPAVSPNYNKIVVSGFKTGAPASAISFTLQVQLYTLGGTYTPIPLQSVISGLPVIMGSTDLSNDPTSIAPDDPTTISFCPNITLPVNLVSFTAKRVSASMVNLAWVTGTELNNKGFQVERQIGTGNWEVVGFVNSLANGGNSSTDISYSFSDLNNTKAITQYRLRQIDLDAKEKFSEIRAVRGLDQKGSIIIYPNPSHNGSVNVIFEDAVTKRDIQLVDMSGRTVRQISGITGNTIILENLQSGMYMIRIMNAATGEQTVEKILVSKR